MKILSSTLLSAIVAGLCAAPSSAQAREALIERFDANGNGVLDGGEPAAARAAVRRRLAGRDSGPTAPDSGSDQQGSGEKRRGLDPASRLNTFDLDGDGFLSESEKASARARWKEWADRRAAGEGGGPGQAGEGQGRRGLRGPGQRQERTGGPVAGGGPGGLQPIPPGSRLALFDRNGDGFLSESEKATGRARLNGADRGQRGGPDGKPGKVEGKGGQFMGPFKRFDQNGDGELTEAERTRARRMVQNLRGGKSGTFKDSGPGIGQGQRRVDQLTPEQRAHMHQRAQKSQQVQDRRRFGRRQGQRAQPQRGQRQAPPARRQSDSRRDI